MCGRFTLNSSSKDIALQFKLLEEPSWRPRYNIAPTQTSLVILGQENTQIAQMGKWGFKSSRSPIESKSIPLINARWETVADKPSFRDAFRNRRCLVAASSFFEWQTLSGIKQPWLFHLPKRKIFSMAGLWQENTSAETCELEFTILTQPAKGKISQIHHRMPLILPQEHEALWLSGSTAQVSSIISTDDCGLTCHRVTQQTNRVSFEEPSCLDPVPEEDLLF